MRGSFRCARRSFGPRITLLAILAGLGSAEASFIASHAAGPPAGRPRAVYTLWGHREEIEQVRLSPDGKWLATVTEKGLVKLWDLGTGRAAHALPTGDSYPRDLAFSPASTLLAVANTNSEKLATLELTLWDVKTGKERRRWNCAKAARALAFSPDGKILASGDEQVKLWDLRTGKAVASLPSPHVSWLVFSPDGKKLAAVDGSVGGSYIRIYDIPKRTSRALLEGFMPWVVHVHFSPDGKRLLSLHSDSKLRTWDLATRKLLSAKTGVRVPRRYFRPETDEYAFSAGARWLATCELNGVVYVWEAATGKKLWCLPPRFQADFGGRRFNMVFSPDGRWFATALGDWAVEVWDFRAILKAAKRSEGAPRTRR